MTADLAGTVAAITGGGSGLGAAMARDFADAGAAVAVLDIDGPAAERVAASVADEVGVATTAARVDVGDVESIAAGARHVADALGGCDIVCANVGVQQFGALDALTDDDWRWLVDVNILGTVRTVREFLPLLRARQGLRRVLLTASVNALVPAVRLGGYQTTKYAVMGFGETLREELAPEGIGVSILFPGGMMTRHLESSVLARPAALGPTEVDPGDIDAMLAHRPLGADDLVTPEHAIRNLVADLVADQPFIVTHGSSRADFDERRAAIDAAYDRMESA